MVTTVRHILTTLLIVAAPRAALACPVCFGQNDSPLASAINMGIIVMLGFIVSVLGGFAAFIIYLARRARQFADDTGAVYPAQTSNPQEGTV
jgi:hypothetical protein